MILTPEEANALLYALSQRDCNPGCKCVFCTVFDEGRRSGLHDAAIEFGRALDEFKQRLAK